MTSRKRLQAIIAPIPFLIFLYYQFSYDKDVIYRTSFQLSVLFAITCMLLPFTKKLMTSNASIFSVSVLLTASFGMYVFTDSQLGNTFAVYFSCLLLACFYIKHVKTEFSSRVSLPSSKR
jgi:hypothetical protein